MIYGVEIVDCSGYSERHLSRNDYWEKGKTVQGHWIGEACQAYGVTQGAVVDHQEFDLLCHNKHAKTHQQVTQRNNSTRKAWVADHDGHLIEKDLPNRRQAYDFTVNAPKTFSALAKVGGLAMVESWHNEATLKAWGEMQRLAVRQDHKSGNRLEKTGALCAAWYKHDTNRCLEPQLHDHFVIMNMTPGKDGNHYAVEARVWMDRAAYFTAVYRDVLAFRAQEAGFGIVYDRWGAPQIKGLEDLIDLYSRRSMEIGILVEKAEELAGTKLNPKETKRIVLASRGLKLGQFNQHWNLNRAELEKLKTLHGTDASKGLLRKKLLEGFTNLVRHACDSQMQQTTAAAVLADQKALMNDEQRERLARVAATVPDPQQQRVTPSLTECLDHAVSHCFERLSARRDFHVIAEAINYGMGSNIDLLELRKAAASRPDLIQCQNAQLTTVEHAQRELDMIKWVEEGRGKGVAVRNAFSAQLSDAQKQAVEHVLSSQDRFTAIVGKAGTGKTHSTKAIVSANVLAGHQCHVMAPSNAARDVLRGEGGGVLERSESLQMFLSAPSLQKQVLPGDLIVLDEAGFACTEDLHALMQFANDRNCRVLLIGDPGQHSSVQAGDAMLVLLNRTNIIRSTLDEIIRQNPKALGGAYLEACYLASEGKITAALGKLDACGVLVEHLGQTRVQAMADEIYAQYCRGRGCIAVNPSHRENDAINAAVREHLKRDGKLTQERVIEAHRSLGLTLAEKRRIDRLQPGQILEVNRGADKGRAFLLKKVEKGVAYGMDGAGVERRFMKCHAGLFDVCQRHDMPVAIGDELLTQAGVRNKKGEVINGERVTVTGFDAEGSIIAKSGKAGNTKVITTKNLRYCYAVTSYRAQGDTQETVLFGMDRNSIAWADRKLSYVALTRGKTEIKVFVENVAELTQIENRKGDRKAATDMEPVKVKAWMPKHVIDLMRQMETLNQQGITRP